MDDIMKWSPKKVAEKIFDLTKNEFVADTFVGEHSK